VDDHIRLIDVGARGGIDPRWEPFHSILDVLGFEPDAEECEELNARQSPYSIRYLPVALGAENGQQANLFICKQPGCSSLLQPNTELCDMYPYGYAMEVVGKIPVTLERMDSVCGDFQPDVLKIDTQGTELDVLRGAGHILDKVLAVELEVEFLPQYVGQPLFSDVDAFMRGQGFTLRALRRTLWRTKADQLRSQGGQIMHGDALYFRPEQMDCEKGHIILAAYRQYDLLAYFGAAQLIPKESLFMRLASRMLSRYSNTGLRRFVDQLRPAGAVDWHDPDFF
jgi:FkbM family methyltransferase